MCRAARFYKTLRIVYLSRCPSVVWALAEEVPVDFDFSPEEQKFADDVEAWLVENHDPVVMDPTRENFTQLADTPERRDFMKKLAA